MNDKIVLILDSKLDNCNKLWLVRGLKEKGYVLKLITVPCSIFELEQKGIIGKAAARFIVLLQAFYTLIISNEKDIVFCWNLWNGLYSNLILKPWKRNIISYCWLTPSNNRLTGWMYKLALNNPNLWAVTNSDRNRIELMNRFQKNDLGNIVYIPDVYDDKEEMQSPIMNHLEKYIFMGGAANRDWELFFRIAKELREYKFIGVASKNNWSQIEEIPENLEMFFDLNEEEYYQIMKNSFIVLIALKEEKISGLINILKGTQYGKVVITTKMEATAQYYPQECAENLFMPGDAEYLKLQLKKIYAMDSGQYKEIVASMQKHILLNFSPERAINAIDEIIKSIHKKMESQCK